MKGLITLFLMLVASVSFGADEFVPKDIVVPGALQNVVDWLVGNRAWVIGSTALVLMGVVNLVKTVGPMLGSKLTGRKAFIYTSVLALVTAFGLAIEDGAVSGNEFTMLATFVAAAIVAPFGYRIAYSEAAKAGGAINALKTMFKK